jgi:hypothetical protein
MPYKFTLHKESIKRKFSVYVVVARSGVDVKLYVGKTGDNREGCNPVISRCGNHFSYNKIHSQVRNKLADHEERTYTYIFDHFNSYPENEQERRACIDKINEMERWLNEEIQKLILNTKRGALLNPYSSAGYISEAERIKRLQFRDDNSRSIIQGIVDEVEKELSQQANPADAE